MNPSPNKPGHTVCVIVTNGERLQDEPVEVVLSQEGKIPLQLTRGNRSYRFTGKKATRRDSGHWVYELAEVSGRERLWIDEYLAVIFED